MASVYLGVDLGGTHLRVGVRRDGEKQLAAVETTLASREWSPEDLAEEIARGLARIREGCPGEIRGLGFALTGDPDPVTGTCHAMTRFPKLEGFALTPFLSERFTAPAYLLNDGLTAALAELRAGAGQGVKDFVMITLGTGVGGGVVLDGQLMTR